MARLFTGIEIPEHIRTELTHFQSGLTDARWIAPENFHLTLRFAGDIDDRLADDFIDFLQMIECPPIEIKLNGLGSFGGKKPRAIWVGVEQSPELMQLQHAHEMAAQKSGLEPETRKFTPHVTLARLRYVSPEAVARYFQERGSVTLPAFELERTVLFSARPGGGGGPYRVETAFPASGLIDQSEDV